MSETPFEQLPYRPCVGIMLINRDGLVWAGRRASDGPLEHTVPGHEWQMPQGGIDPGEDPLPAARRELWEETGVTSVSLLAESPGWFHYDIPRDVVGGRWKSKWRGQTQKWFALRFEGEDSEVNISDPPNGEPEFDQWRWERMERLPELIVPFKRAVYEQVVAAFRHLGAP